MPTTSVTDDANSEAGGHTAQTHRETGPELEKARMDGHFLSQASGDDDGGYEAVDGENLRHDCT